LRFLIGCKTLINGSFAFGLIGCTLIKPYGLEPFQFQLSLGHLLIVYALEKVAISSGAADENLPLRFIRKVNILLK